jgi:TPR repeat protein
MNRIALVGFVLSIALSFTYDASSAEDPCSTAYNSATDSASFEQCRALALTGEKSAQLGYGLILWSGYDRKPNRSEALEWWRRAARQGHLLAQIALADLLSHPDLDPALRNDVEAYAWRSALGREHQASELWKTLSPEQQERAKSLAEEFKAKYVLPR